MSNRRTTPTANINFVNLYGAPVTSTDDYANFTTYGILTNSGGAHFTKGIQVTGGATISYNPYHMLEIIGTGANIKGDWNITGSLSLNSFSIGSDISFSNMTQTSIICKNQWFSVKHEILMYHRI